MGLKDTVAVVPTEKAERAGAWTGWWLMRAAGCCTLRYVGVAVCWPWYMFALLAAADARGGSAGDVSEATLPCLCLKCRSDIAAVHEQQQ